MRRDYASQFAEFTSSTKPTSYSTHVHHPPHACVLSGTNKFYTPTKDELWDLRMIGCRCADSMTVSQLPITWIMNVHFRSAEWGNTPRCDSVVTCVLKGHGRFHGISLYARVERFLHVDGAHCPGYASVRWFSKPNYFIRKSPLGVSVSLDGREIDRELGCIIRITQIDPCSVMVERDGDHYIMMRDRGWDTRRLE